MLAWSAGAAVCACCGAWAQGPAKDDSRRAAEAYLDGARLLDQEQLPEAQERFALAARLDGTRNEYGMALTLTREHRVNELIQRAAKERLTGHAARADTLLGEARTIDPENERVLARLSTAEVQMAGASADAKLETRLKDETRFSPPIQLAPTAGLQDLHLRGDTRQVVTQAALAYGIKVVFDDSVASQAIRFDLEQTSYPEAIPILLRMTHLFAVPIDTKTLLAVKDTEGNRQKFERQVEETLYIPGSSKAQLDELTNIVKSVFDVKQVVSSEMSGTLLIRAPEETIKAVNYTIADLVQGSAEVLIEVKLVSIDKSLTHNTGLSTPTSAGIFNVNQEAQQLVTANQALVNQFISSGGYTPTGNTAADLLTEALYLVLSGAVQDAKISNLLTFFGGGKTLTGVFLGQYPTLNFGLNTSESHALDDITVRVGDRQTTELKVGQKYPITTATFGSGVSAATSKALAGITVNGVSAQNLLNQYLGAGSAATVPMITYEDLGLVLKTTPTVMKSGLVSMHIDLKLEALTGATLDNIPVLTSSNFVSDITVQDGASVVMLADMSKTEAAAVSGLPILSELPGFQASLADRMKTTSASELVLLVTPHVIHHRRFEIASRRIRFNTSVPQDN